jgi:hypothetical protein
MFAEDLTDSSWRSFLASDGVVRELDDVEPAPYCGARSEAIAVNADGTVVGTICDEHGLRAVAWKEGVKHELGMLPGASISRALAIDAAGTVYGVSCAPDLKEMVRGCTPVRFGNEGPVSLGAIDTHVDVASMTSAGSAILADPRGYFASPTLIWDDGSVVDLSRDAARYSWSRGSPERISIAVRGPNAAGDAALVSWAPITEGAVGVLALLHEGELYDVSEMVDLAEIELHPSPAGKLLYFFPWILGFNDKGQILVSAGGEGGPSTRYLLLTPHPDR